MSSVFFWLLVIVVVYCLNVVRKKQKTIQALKTKQLSLNHSVRQLQTRFRDLVVELTAQYELQLDTEHKRRLVAVGNNYFVFQAVNQLNVERLSDLIDTFSNCFAQLDDTEWDPKDTIQSLVSKLCEALPSDTRSFNSQFYLEVAPRLFFDLSDEISTVIEKNAASVEVEEQSLAVELEVEDDEAHQTYQDPSVTEQPISNNTENKN